MSYEDEIEYFDEKHLQLYLNALPKCEHFHSKQGRPTQYGPYLWQIYFLVLYYCAIRLAETKRLTIQNFDLDKRLLNVPNRKGGYNKTTIAPPAIPHLKKFFLSFKDNAILFPMDRSRAWQITKETGRIAGIKYFEIMENKEIDGLYTYVFKHAYEQRMEELNCKGTLISMKLRHRPQGKHGQQVTERYGMRWRRLMNWERENITETIYLVE